MHFFTVPYISLSERPGCAELYTAAALFSCPACNTEVKRHRTTRLYLPAKLKHTAAAFEARTWSAVSVKGRSRITVKLILVGQTTVEAVFSLILWVRCAPIRSR